MKFLCGGSDINDATSKVKGVLGNSPNPILNGIKIVANKNNVTFTATDGDTIIERIINADVLIEGETVVEGRFFCDLVSKIRNTQIEIVLDKNNQMSIKYNDNIVDAICFDPQEYPKTKLFDKDKSFTIIKSEFCELIKKIEFCASTDNSRPILKGVYFEVDKDTITGVALDGYRLAKVVKPIIKYTDKITAIVPAKPLKEVANIVESNLDTMEVYVDKSYMMIDLMHTKIAMRLLEGEYINYRQVIPTTFSATVTLPKVDFRDSIDRVKLITREEKNNVVTIEFGQSLTTLSSKSERGTITERVASKIDGVESKIGFNAKFLTDALNVIDTESVTIKMNTPTSPTVYLPTGGDDSVLYLVLPIRINN